MGQRHQVFLIARVTPYSKPLGETRYRCIAALHHQWCYGRLPLNAATRFFTLIKQKENAEIIREEILNIHGLYGIFRTRPQLPEVPCPFTHYLMQSAWSSNLNDPNDFYESGSLVLPAGMSCTDGDNNDGITIIDVTNPVSPAYCFVSIPSMTPLSATQYVRGYYPEVKKKDDSETPDDPDHKLDELEQSVLNTLRPFESVRMITIDMLAEAWPKNYSNKLNSAGLSIELKDTVHMPPSLVDMTFVPALNSALQTGEIDCLDPFMWLPGNLSKIKETLRAHNPLSEIDLALLSKAITVEVTQTKSIDLSRFSLTGEQLIELLSANKGVEVLNISHMQQITIDILRQFIPLLPNLRRLVLLHTIPDTDILTLLSESPELFYRIDSIIHFAFLRPMGKAIFPAAFSHIIPSRSAEVLITSVPYFTPDQIAQGLTDYLSVLKSEDEYTVFTCMKNELPLMASYASAVREPGRSWSERIVPFIPRKTSDEIDELEGWFFCWSGPESFTNSPSYSYAFAKSNKEAIVERQRRIDELRESSKLPNLVDTSSTPLNLEGQSAVESDAKLDNSSEGAITSDELRDKENAVVSEYADREFHIFGVSSFFQELVKEGRPAPSPEILTKLLELFEFLDKRFASLKVMTPADLNSFLDKTSLAKGIIRHMARMFF